MPRSSDHGRRLGLVSLELFTSVAAIAGGLLLVIEPNGTLLQAKTSALHNSPFADWRVPGALLTVLVGGGLLLAGVAQVVRWRHARVLSLLAGAGLVAFESPELAWIGFHPLQVVFGGVGVVIAVLARPPASRPPRRPEVGPLKRSPCPLWRSAAALAPGAAPSSSATPRRTRERVPAGAVRANRA